MANSTWSLSLSVAMRFILKFFSLDTSLFKDLTASVRALFSPSSCAFSSRASSSLSCASATSPSIAIICFCICLFFARASSICSARSSISACICCVFVAKPIAEMRDASSSISAGGSA